MMKTMMRGAAIAAMLVTVTSMAMAAEEGRRSGGGGREGAREGMMDRRMAKVSEELGLDTATTTALKAILTRQMEENKALAEKLKTEARKLKGLVDDDASDAAISSQLAKLTDLRDQMHAAQKSASAEVQALLGARNAARLVLMRQAQMQNMRERLRGGDENEGGGSRRRNSRRNQSSNN